MTKDKVIRLADKDDRFYTVRDAFVEVLEMIDDGTLEPVKAIIYVFDKDQEGDLIPSHLFVNISQMEAISLNFRNAMEAVIGWGDS